MSLNKVMLIGNVGKDPEVRYLDGGSAAGGQGTKVAQFTLATSERYRDRSGEQKENTEWHNIVAWRTQADIIEKYVHKGTQVYIEGKLRTRSWVDASGVKKYQTEIIADTLQLLGKRGDGEGAPAPSEPAYRQNQYQQSAPQQSYQAPAQAPAPAAPVQDAISIPIDDGSDDLPF